MTTRLTLTPEERIRREAIVADQYGGIVPTFEVFYLESIAYAAGRAVAAFERFDSALSEAKGNEEVVAAVQEALTHVAGLSRFFWPPAKEKVTQARARKLRMAFGLDDGSVLQSRELRNALEHFDERLDAFLLHDHAGYFFPGAMVDDASLSEDAIGHIFRLVDPNTSTFVLLGQAYSFAELRSVAKEISDKATTSSRHGGRL
jgi:hypothetical protein